MGTVPLPRPSSLELEQACSLAGRAAPCLWGSECTCRSWDCSASNSRQHQHQAHPPPRQRSSSASLANTLTLPLLMAPTFPSIRPPTPDADDQGDNLTRDFEDPAASVSHSEPLTRRASRSNLLSVPPSMSASTDEDAGDASVPPAAVPQNPFNFQTQVISAGPVKSVRTERSPLDVSRSLLISNGTEHWPAPWPQI